MASGSSRTVSVPRDCPVVALVVSTLVICAEISTFSLTAPGFNVIVTFVVSVTRTSMPEALASANPDLFTTTMYVPGGSSGTTNNPSAFVETLRASDSVRVSIIWTSASATDPPLVSTTAPLIAPVAPPCAYARVLISIPAITNAAARILGMPRINPPLADTFFLERDREPQDQDPGKTAPF